MYQVSPCNNVFLYSVPIDNSMGTPADCPGWIVFGQKSLKTAVGHGKKTKSSKRDF